MLSNRLPIYLYSKLDYTEINYRVLRADTQEVVRGTACDPDQAKGRGGAHLAAKCRWPPRSDDHPASLCA